MSVLDVYLIMINFYEINGYLNLMSLNSLVALLTLIIRPPERN